MDGANYTADLLGPTWALTVLSSLFVVGRCFTRFFTRNRLGWDDFWAVVSMVLNIAMSISLTTYALYGGTVNAEHQYKTQVSINISSWLAQTFSISSINTAKLAVAALILRLGGPVKWRSRLLWGLLSLAVVWALLQIGLVWGQCTPAAALWNPKAHPNAKCRSPKVIVYNGIACSSYWAFVDLCLAAIPVQMIMKLQMRLKKKIGVCALLSTGVFAAAVTIVRTTKLLADLHPNADSVHEFVIFFIWNILEVNVVIISCCIPTLVPLYEVASGRGSMKSLRSGGSGDNSQRTRSVGSYDSWRARIAAHPRSSKQEFDTAITSTNISLDSNDSDDRTIVGDEPQKAVGTSVTTGGDVGEERPGIHVTQEYGISYANNRAC